MSLDPLGQSIAKTLHYFDIAGYPLTKEELFAYLWQPPAMGYAEFLERLDKVEGIAAKGGYYFLPGREDIILDRQRRLITSEEKMRIAVKAAKKLRAVPFLRAIFVCNSVGAELAGEDSDIDFFIVTEKKRIWITRILVTIIMEIFRLRRTGARIKNKICLSFYVTEDNLDLSPWRVADDDVHFAYWLNQMTPIFDGGGYFKKFLVANGWTRKFLPNLNSGKTYDYISKISRPSAFGMAWKKMWERMWRGMYGNMVESQAKQAQIAKMKLSGKSVDRKDDKNVVISDGVLKFHEKDARLDYREKWRQRIINY